MRSRDLRQDFTNGNVVLVRIWDPNGLREDVTNGNVSLGRIWDPSGIKETFTNGVALKTF